MRVWGCGEQSLTCCMSASTDCSRACSPARSAACTSEWHAASSCCVLPACLLPADCTADCTFLVLPTVLSLNDWPGDSSARCCAVHSASRALSSEAAGCSWPHVHRPATAVIRASRLSAKGDCCRRFNRRCSFEWLPVAACKVHR